MYARSFYLHKLTEPYILLRAISSGHSFFFFCCPNRRDIYSEDAAGNRQLSTIGFAPVGSMCNSPRSCAIVQDQGTSSAFTMAHEAGHV